MQKRVRTLMLQEYTVDINLIMQWRDVRLIHTFAPYILIKEKSIIERLWRADPYFINEKDATLVDVTYPNMKMTVFPEGEVIYEMRSRKVAEAAGPLFLLPLIRCCV